MLSHFYRAGLILSLNEVPPSGTAYYGMFCKEKLDDNFNEHFLFRNSPFAAPVVCRTALKTSVIMVICLGTICSSEGAINVCRRRPIGQIVIVEELI